MNIVEPKVYIIILNWNRWEDTIECLCSVYRMDYTNYQVLVIDNASINDSVMRLRAKFPNLRLIENFENIGFTGGNNQGMRIAMSENADYVWLLNSDTVVENDTLSKLVNVAEQCSDIGMVSPTIYYHESPAMCQFRGSKVDWEKFAICYPDIDDEDSTYSDGDEVCLWGTALLIKKNLIKINGELREDYFAYYEDTEYSLRAIKNGFKNKIVSKARIYHKTAPPLSNGSIRSPYYYYYMIRNSYYMWKDLLDCKEHRHLWKKLLVIAVQKAASLNDKGQKDHSHACIQALYDALTGVRGKQPVHKTAPLWLVRLILWHPYLFLNIIFGNFKGIQQQIYTRVNRLLKDKRELN